MKQKYIKENFMKFRIDKIEQDRLSKIVKLTRRRRSDIYRDSFYMYLQEYYPQVLEEENQ